MRRFAQTLDLIDDPDVIAAYDAEHRAVWPEVLRGLRAIGIRTMTIWRFGTRLFMLVETDDEFDPARDYQRYALDPRAQAWDERMRQWQLRVPARHSQPAHAAARPEGPAASAEPWWSPMSEIFDLESQLCALQPSSLDSTHPDR
mgnify:CR=1 FL=1